MSLLLGFLAVTGIACIAIWSVVSGRRAAEAQLRQAKAELETKLRGRESELQSAIDSLGQSERRLQTIIDTCRSIFSGRWQEVLAPGSVA